MSGGPRGAVLHQIQRLFQIGTASGLSEWQLLRRYLALRDEAAFEALVARHGPMVLGVCRRMLHDPGDVEDAFQATFLVLVRRANVLSERDAIGPWLYGVAHRVSLRARAVSIKRTEREVHGVEIEVPVSAGMPDQMDLRGVLDEELGRLPSKYRDPVVLCYLEGQSHEEAARRLGWPVGSVKGRLSRARELLKGRLTRRGVAFSAGSLSLALSRGASASVPELLCAATVGAAVRFAASRSAAGFVSASVLGLTQGGLRNMAITKVSIAAMSVLVTTGAIVWASQPSKKRDADADKATPAAAVARGVDQASIANDDRDRETKRCQELRDREDQLRELQAVAQRDVEVTYEDVVRGEGRITDIERFSRASRALAEADAGFSKYEAGRLAAFEAHRDRMKILMAALEKRREKKDESAAITAAARSEAKPLLVNDPTPTHSDREPRNPAGRDVTPHGSPLKPGLSDRTDAIRSALKTRMSVSSNGLPLQDFLKQIKEATKGPTFPAGIPMYVDPVALRDVNLTLTTPVDMKGENFWIEPALHTALEMMRLAYTVKEGMLVISSKDEVALVELGELREEVAALASQLGASARTTGRAAVSPVADGRPLRQGSPRTVVPKDPPDEDAQTEAILAALDKVVPLSLTKAPLADVVRAIQTATISPELPQGIPVYVDPGVLLDRGQYATLNLKGVRLKTSLRLMLNQMSVAYTVKEGLLMIVSLDSPELESGGAPMGVPAGMMGGMGSPGGMM